MLALVTGHDGFVGRYLMRELREKGWEAVGLEEAGASNPCSVDVRDGLAVARAMVAVRPDVVFHLAAISGPMLLTESPATVTAVNCLGTIHLLEAAAWCGARRLVFAATTSGYDAGTARDPRPKDVYGATKRFGEFVAAQYRDAGKLDTVAAQIGMVYGPGRMTRCYIRVMVRGALSGRPVTYDPAEVDFIIHVRDCARYLAALGALDRARSSYQVVTARVTMHDLATLIGREVEEARFEPRQGMAQAWPVEFSPDDLVADTGLAPLVPVEAGVLELVQAERAAATAP